jgi:ADP-L-glycero-D-manno-heptose 6-epimerase
MASMVHQLYAQLRTTGVAPLFTGSGGYGDGEQRRDFVFVRDVVAVNLFFAEKPTRKGLFNVGSGRSRTFNDLARALIAPLVRGEIQYIPFPESLGGKYQSFTEADITRLREAGYDRPFTTLEDGVAELSDLVRLDDLTSTFDIY